MDLNCTAIKFSKQAKKTISKLNKKYLTKYIFFSIVTIGIIVWSKLLQNTEMDIFSPNTLLREMFSSLYVYFFLKVQIKSLMNRFY